MGALTTGHFVPTEQSRLHADEDPVSESHLLRSYSSLPPIALAILTTCIPFVKKCIWCKGSGCDPEEYRSWYAREELCSCCYGGGYHVLKPGTYCSLENIEIRLREKQQQVDAGLKIAGETCNKAFGRAEEEKNIRVLQLLHSVRFKTLSDKNRAVNAEQLSLNASSISLLKVIGLSGLPTTRKKRKYLSSEKHRGELLRQMMDMYDNLSRMERARSHLVHSP